MSEVMGMRLLSGEEIIGNVVEDGDNYIVSKPRAVVLVPINQSELAPRIMPWFISNQDGDIPIPKSIIVAGPVTPIKELADAYLQETTSIALPG